MHVHERVHVLMHVCMHVLQAVELFLAEKVGYLDIMRLVERCCDEHRKELVVAPNLDEIVHYDNWAREYVEECAAAVVA